MIPDNVEKIIMTKEDYDRNVEQIIKENCELKLVLDKIKPMLEELKNLYDDNYTVSDKVGDILELLEETY